MKILLDIKDNKVDFVLELLHNLSFVKAKPVTKKNKETGSSLPDRHIAVLQQRLNTLKKNPKSVINFDKAIDDIEKEL